MTSSRTPRSAVALGDLVDPLARLGAGEAANLGGEKQIFGDRHLVVERRMIGQVPHPRAHVVGVIDDVEPVDPHAPRGRQKIASQDAQGGRLAGAVEAEQADDLPFGDGERQRADRFAIAVVLR